MKTICTKCGSDEVYTKEPIKEKLPETQTMDEIAKKAHEGVPLVYIYTTLICKKCGHSVSY